MLVELAVTDLGVIDRARLVLGPGLTALTGETGAGKTMLVEAIALLLGGRADPALVRPGAAEAVVEGRFADGDDEVVLTRVVPRDGRSRAYLDGRMATAAALAERGRELVDLLGQHAHQALLTTAAQREALDRAAGIDLAPLAAARARVAEIDRRLAALGGDAGARAREIDLLRYQLAELEDAGVGDPDEDTALDAEEDALADATSHREAAATAAEVVGAEGGGRDALAAAHAAVAGRAPFADLADRLAAALAEVEDLAGELRDAVDRVVDDPERLAVVRERRQLLVDLIRKYGTARAGPDAAPATGAGTLGDVIAYRDEASDRLADLEAHDERAAALDAERAEAVAAVARAEAAVGAARRTAAPRLARAVTRHLRDLALPGAEVRVTVGDADPGDDVAVLLAADRGAPALPVAKAASGGELARTGLALRLVLTADQPTLVFDEVDAGIGGEAAVAVGRALAALARDRQVLVVTHLAQVAAFATAQIGVTKRSTGGRATSEAVLIEGDDRVVELSRMLSGTPDSPRVREAAAELLATAAATRPG
ncbi:AAA family ATPase [Iamia sp. SCSIO 61187]|uniref:DNA repair protein RecN n=1 Tax=Iamia sp. SCSIO 61187 TaxID=2722752 RepID=UPI001C635FA8|nr:AAA family ATPase [Iamia sp. SCSIO 61187]QYG92830.1 AAA family ATPase [Iamia sp. SCSIO 61187]